MSCTDCLGTIKEVQTAMSALLSEAKRFAVENKSLVIIYKTDDGSLNYMMADKAREIGVVPVQYISYLQPNG